MKIAKWIMAAAMAAMMASATAADSTKGFAIKRYYDVSRSSAGVGESTRIISAEEIAAGNVTVPCAVHFLEATANTKGLMVGVTVTSENGNASNAYVFFAIHEIGEDYFADNWSGTLGGKNFSTKSYIGFAGVIKENKKRGFYYSPSGRYALYGAQSQMSAGTANAYIGYAWTIPVDNSYQWTSEKSDTNPLFVFDVVLAKGTPAGTYKVKFCEWDTDPTDEGEVPAPMVEGQDGKVYTRKAGNLTLSEMTITVQPPPLAGDANCDGFVDLSDAILIMQVLYNPDKYGVNGTDPTHITAQGMSNADVDGSKSVTGADALMIQMFMADKIARFPNHTAQNSVAHGHETANGPLRGSSLEFGDANIDGKVTVADAVAILQCLTLPDKYQLTPQGRLNADVEDTVIGVSPGDALVLFQVDAGCFSLSDLPITNKTGN